MTATLIEGRAWRFGSDVDTDVIFPWQYANLERSEYGNHVMEPANPDFADAVEPGDCIVAETNFGIGSSREHAPIAIQAAGVGAVIAASFGRIFYRNAVNQGLPPIECEIDDITRIEEGDTLAVDLAAGTVENVDAGETYDFEPFQEPVSSILAAGGAAEYYR